MTVLRNSQVYVYLVNVSFKFINQSLSHSFLWLSQKINFLDPNTVIFGQKCAHKRNTQLIKLSRISLYKNWLTNEWWIDMQNFSYFSGNIENWQMSGFCQKLTANVTWWDIDDPFWTFLLERLSKQLSWFLGRKFVIILAGACLQYLKLSVRMTQLWQWHIMTVTYRPTKSYTTPHHHHYGQMDHKKNFSPRWEFL